MNIGSAIISLLPEIEDGKDFEYRNDSDGKGAYLLWHSKTISKPTDAEINAEVIRLQTEYDAQAYSRKREEEYPSVQECVHAILDDTLDALQAKRASIKTKYPKSS